MRKNALPRWLPLAAAFLFGGGNLADYQAVIFPQENQPGQASLTESEGVYTLSNDLFSVDFVKADGKLMFAGSERLFLLPGDELFSITLGDGTVVPASGMTLGEVRMATLTPDLKAARASEKLSGQALEADFTYGDLTLLWKAVLRDGSHYLRTSLDLTAGAADVAMKNIKPMIYTVDNVSAGSAPVVVGNTRGAVLASDKIFAGLETPMGLNTVPSTSDVTNFVHDSWTTESWAWLPGDETPEGVLAAKAGLTSANVVGYRGALAFKETGVQTITFQFTTGSGSHKLNVVGVDLVKDDAVVSSDYHYGSTGNSHSNNVYTIDVPEKGAYLVRFFVETLSESVDSKGTITYSKSVKPASVVFATDPNKEAAQKAPAMRVLSNVEVAVGTAVTDTWAPNDWVTVADAPSGVSADLGISVGRLLALTNTVNITSRGMLSVKFTWDGGYRRQDIAGVDLLDEEGEVVACDYHKAYTGGSRNTIEYILKAPAAGSYTLRYWGTYSDTDELSDSDGNIEINLTAIKTIDLQGSTTATGAWTPEDWTDMEDSEVPATILDNGVTAANVKCIQQDVIIPADGGQVTTEFLYTGGNNKLIIAGVDVLDDHNKVVASDYHEGAAGKPNKNNLYTLLVPSGGTYTLRYLYNCLTTGGEGNTSKGDINLGFTSIPTLKSEDDGAFADGWTQAEWQTVTEAPAAVTGLGFEASQLRTITTDYLNVTSRGKLSAKFAHTGGSMKLCMTGLEVLDADGNVVACDYHIGYAGSSPQNDTYVCKIPAAGFYKLRYWSQTKEEGLSNSTGTITVSLEKLPLINLVEDETTTDSWTPLANWTQMAQGAVPARIIEVGFNHPDVHYVEKDVVIPVAGGKLEAEFIHTGGSHRLDIVGVDLLDGQGNVLAYDYHFGFSGTDKSNHIYSFTAPYAGTYTLRYFSSSKDGNTNTSGNINLTYGVEYTLYLPPLATSPIQGLWSRNTTLQAGKTWNVSAVVGLIAPGQARRSFLAYSERERAVPWRPFPVYISWYELNINRNNDANYTTNMNVTQCTDVVNQWKTNLYEKHNANVKSFVWDDGWDNYGLWTFNKNFPNGFAEPNEAAEAMKSNIGAWLGPVGGYGESGNYRRAYWNAENRGGMQLSNPDYYDVFLTACTNMINDYSFNFFKFDGISGQFSAVGPDNGDQGNENAEAIINIEREVRKIKPDIFLNTTVGTWASPFWFQFTDAVWRQENDYDVIGDNDIKRENWITYRDRLVYQNFVQNSPLCPINTLMTHGFILTEYGPPANPYNDSYEAIRRELRCAFACGSGMVELYNDFLLTNSTNDGALWADIAECIRWQERNADVLPDIHWVGGNPWTGAKAEVYGWASWNGKKATLALRNGANGEQSYTFTLREALDIPAYVTTTVKLSQAFEVQDALPGLVLGKSYDIDEEITVTLPGSSAFVFDGIDEVGSETVENGYNLQVGAVGISTLHLPYAATIPAGVTVKYLTAETADPTQVEEGVYTLKYTTIEGNILPANTPVVVMAEAGNYAFMETTEAGTPVTGNLLVGSSDGKKPSTADQLYALGVREGVVAFYPYEGIGYNPNKAYLDITSLNLGASSNVKELRFVDDKLTGLDAVEAAGNSEEKIYIDLSGRRVKNPARGIYIQGGKKVIITK